MLVAEPCRGIARGRRISSVRSAGYHPDGTVVSKDDGPRRHHVEGWRRRRCSVLTGADRGACPLNDGAAAVIVMSEERAGTLNSSRSRIVASGVTAPIEIMGLGPIEACRQAMGRAKLTIDDADLVEINEAFAAQVVPSAKSSIFRGRSSTFTAAASRSAIPSA